VDKYCTLPPPGKTTTPRTAQELYTQNATNKPENEQVEDAEAAKKAAAKKAVAKKIAEIRTRAGFAPNNTTWTGNNLNINKAKKLLNKITTLGLGVRGKELLKEYKIDEILGFKFKNKSRLIQHLDNVRAQTQPTVPSTKKPRVPSYQKKRK